MLRALLLTLAAAAPAQKLEVEKYRLPNDLTVILHEDHSLPVACVNLWYHVGSKDEAARRSGFAHLFEHLMFMGTKRVPGSDFDRLMEAGGGWNNASTSEDRTNYFSFGPSSLLPTLLWLDADRLEDLGREMTQEKLDKQRDVVRNERRQTSEMEPYGKAELKIGELMFPEGHPYHHPVIGSHEDLEAATLKDVVDFFANYYVPANASLVVAGDFDPAKIKPLIASLFGTLPRGSDPMHRTAPPARLTGTTRVTFTDRVQFPRVSMVWHSPAAYRPGDAEVDLAADVLADGKSSRLYQRLIYQEPLATDVRARQSSMMLGSLFTIEVTARAGVPLDKIEAAVDEVVRGFVETGPTEDELRRRQIAQEVDLLRSLESLLTRADRLNAYNFHFGEPNAVERDLDRYRKATPAGVRDVARLVLLPDARLVMRVVPDREEETRAERDRRPEAGASAAFLPAAPETFKLSSGLEVRHWPKRELPLVGVRLLFKGGAALDAPEQAGRAWLTAAMLDEGAGDLGAVEFTDALDRLGASFQAGVSQETTFAMLSTLKRTFAPAAKLFADAVLRPRFEPKEWERVRRLHVESLKQEEDRASSLARRVGLQAFFGPGHPYGRPADGSVATVEKLGVEQLRECHRRLFLPANAVLFTAGDLTADEARSALEETFGKWRAEEGATAARTPEPGAAPERRELDVVLVEKPGAVQTVIRLYLPGPVYQSPERIRFDLLGVVLGGSFTSRLNQNLREQHGYSYGASSRFVTGRLAGYGTAGSDVQASVTGAALKEFLGELKRIRGGDVSAEEAGKARQQRRTDVIEGLQSLSGLLGTAATLEANGVAWASLGEELEAIDKLGERDLNALAGGAFPLERGLLVLAGDPKTIREQIAGGGLPEPRVVKPDGAK